MNSTQAWAPCCAIGVGVALLAMITLLPALLVIFGRWIFWPVKPAFGTPRAHVDWLLGADGRAISHRPRHVWVGTSWSSLRWPRH